MSYLSYQSAMRNV